MSKLWIVGQVSSESYWEFLGVFDTEDKAVNACLNGQCFVASAELNEALTGDVEEWPNAYYPIREEIDGSGKFTLEAAQKVILQLRGN